MPDVHDEVETADPIRWVTGTLYVALLAANLYLVFDWWRGTPEGEAFIAKVKAKAKECEGCAQRKAMLRKAMNRMHFQAEQIVEGVDVETQPEP